MPIDKERLLHSWGRKYIASEKDLWALSFEEMDVIANSVRETYKELGKQNVKRGAVRMTKAEKSRQEVLGIIADSINKWERENGIRWR